jgi:hypothetical protein
MDNSERGLLRSINQILQDSFISRQIDSIADRLIQRVAQNNDSIAWETVPMELYPSELLPREIRSSWVFLLREGCASGAERHPNSHQRVRSWKNAGDFQIWNQDHWESHHLKNGFDSPVEEQWASIPVNVWHQAVVPPGNHWIVVSFHTAAAEELIEERPDPNDLRQTQQRFYAMEN